MNPRHNGPDSLSSYDWDFDGDDPANFCRICKQRMRRNEVANDQRICRDCIKEKMKGIK